MTGRQDYKLVFAKQAQKDAKKLSTAGLKGKAEELFELIAHDPYQSPPRSEKLVGNLSGAISRRINIQHRLVYQVIEEEKTIKVLRMWTRCE